MLGPVSERRAALERQHAPWHTKTLDEFLDEAAARYPDRPFVVTDDRTYTYGEVQAWSYRLARGLRLSGVQPGDHVALVMANYPEFVALKFAVARAGAVAVPINFLNRRDELAYVLGQSDAKLVVTMDRFRGFDYLSALDEIAPGWEQSGGGTRLPMLERVVVFPAEGTTRIAATSLADLEDRGRDAVDVMLGGASPSSPSDVLYTSGTTGNPKGVILTHDMLLRTAYASVYTRAFEDGRSILFSLPLYHVYGYVEGLLAVPFVGGSAIIQLGFDAKATLAGIERHRASDALFVPTMTLDVLDAGRDGAYDLSSLTAVFSSGGQSPQRIWSEILDVLAPEELVTGYGMSETTASQTCTLPDGPFERLLDSNGRMKDAGAAGDPEIGGRVAVYRAVDSETGREVPPGTVGELFVRGPAVTCGYYKKPDETSEAFDADGWLRTGDLGTLDDEGYLLLVGRKKDCYRCGGEQVVPKEIEDVLTAHPAVAQAHVVPLPDERMGEVGVAWVVFKDGAFASSQELIDHCVQRLARFKVPRHVLPITTSELPTTPSGRPKKFLLAERAAELLISS
jgi:fatty-acyl-CoA synthase